MILVDEYNTSKACPVDDKVAVEKVVVKKFVERIGEQQPVVMNREIRGLRRCAHIHVVDKDNGGVVVSHCNSSGSRGTLLNRDEVGAVNIAKRLICLF